MATCMTWRSAFLLMLAFVTACNAATEPLLHDIDVARARWLANRPAEYEFEVATATSWTPKSPYHRATVVGESVVAVVDENGVPVTLSWAISLDSLWKRIITERAQGSLNSAVFSQSGIPLEVDWGPWPVDGGVHYYVRNFTRRR
jgi:hypothetical protein